MARERMVTRTINETTVSIMALDVTTASVSIQKFKLSGTYTEDEALKACKKRYETDTLKLVHVDSMEETEILYGMPEDEFMKLAKVLPPRTEKLYAKNFNK